MSGQPIAYLRDRFVPLSTLQIAIHDLGFLMGVTVTDQVRTYRQQPFRLAEHVTRFCDSCRKVQLDLPHQQDQIDDITREILDQNRKHLSPGQEMLLVLFATPGESPRYTWDTEEVRREPTFGVHASPLSFSRWAGMVREGARLMTPKVRQLPPQCVDPHIKVRSRFHWWLAEREAASFDAQASPLLLDLKDNPTETSFANFLVVKDGVVISPKSSGILPGISRMMVAELCQQMEVRFLEQDLQMSDIMMAEEAFLTSTPFGMAPVTSVNGSVIAGGRIGALFQQLSEKWSERVGLDIIKQIGAQ